LTRPARPTTFIEPEGTSLKAALDVARKYGAVRERDLPFSVARLYKGDAKATAGVLAEYHADTAEGGHAVALVGYDENHFIVRNRWGVTQRGDKGFGYASTAYAQAAFTEAYGITL
jgi:Papain family cysteine protease